MIASYSFSLAASATTNHLAASPLPERAANASRVPSGLNVTRRISSYSFSPSFPSIRMTHRVPLRTG